MILYNGDEINAVSMAAAAGENKAFELEGVECRDGYVLAARSPDAGVVIWAKANPGDAFQNIQTTPIDLTPYAGNVRTFYFECRVDAGEPAESLIYEIEVGLPA